MRRLPVAVGAVLVASACAISSASTSSATTYHATHNATMLVSTSLVPTATKTTLDCRTAINWTNVLPADYTAILNRVGLKTRATLQVTRLPDEKPSRRYFAKQGLRVKPGASFELVVPSAWVGRLSIGWGDPAKPTSHLSVSACRSRKPGAHWIGFAGGYWVKTPACVPLIVKAASQQRTVHIGVGKACPGQSPPPK